MFAATELADSLSCLRIPAGSLAGNFLTAASTPSESSCAASSARRPLVLPIRHHGAHVRCMRDQYVVGRTNTSPQRTEQFSADPAIISFHPFAPYHHSS